MELEADSAKQNSLQECAQPGPRNPKEMSSPILLDKQRSGSEKEWEHPNHKPPCAPAHRPGFSQQRSPNLNSASVESIQKKKDMNCCRHPPEQSNASFPCLLSKRKQRTSNKEK
jgi:hypothetical protein